MKNTLIGIDVGSRSVRMAQISENNAEIAVNLIPEFTVKNGRIIEPETVSRIIRKIVSENHFTGKKCAVALPEFSVFFRNLVLPSVTEEQLVLNLPYEFRDYVGEEGNKYYYDYSIVNYNYSQNGGTVNSIEMYAAAALKETVAQYEKILKDAGLKMVLALPREMALINLINDFAGDDENFDLGFAVVDIGYTITRVYIFSGRKLKTSRIIEIGCRDIDVEIANLYELEIYPAAGHRASNYENVLYSEACRNIYDTISLEVMKVINYYKYDNPESRIDGIFFCGEGSNIDVLKDNIVSYIELNSHDLSELIPYKYNNKKNVYLCSLALAVTLQEDW